MGYEEFNQTLDGLSAILTPPNYYWIGRLDPTAMCPIFCDKTFTESFDLVIIWSIDDLISFWEICNSKHT